MRAWAIALGALLAACTQDVGGGDDPGIRETGYLFCREGGDTCGARWACTGPDGTRRCLEPSAECARPTCACASEALCGPLACHDVEGGVTCVGPTPGVPADASLRADAGGPADASPFADADVTSLEYEGPANPSVLVRGASADGVTDTLTVTFRATLAGQPPSPPVHVEFSVERQPSSTALDPESADTDADGRVSVRFHAGGTPGVVTIVARGLIGGESYEAKSPDIRVVSGTPSARDLHFACDQEVQAAFRDDGTFAPSPTPNRCTLRVADRLGGVADVGTPLFLAEAGVVDGVTTSADGSVSGNLLAIAPAPAAAPAPGMPAAGVVTVAAVVRGEEAFTDADGNSFYEDGVDVFEPAQDLAEPFVDANDNGQWDVGEVFRDLNGNGAWDPANGIWDNDTEIWTATKVVWVGPADPAKGSLAVECGDGCATDAPLRADCPPSDFYVRPGGTATLRFRFADANGNCLAAGGQGTATLSSTSEAVRFLPGVVNLADGCRVNGAPGAATLESVLSDPGPAPAAAEQFRVTVAAEYPIAGGGTRSLSYALTGCR